MRRLGLWALAAVLAWGWPTGTARAEGWLGLPIDCKLGQTCWPRRYVDHDPGPGQLDYRCGALTGDDHKGTDIGFGTLAEIQGGVSVIASAAGIVKAARDGEIDGGHERLTPGRECGNGVLIDHGGEWTTQYCHLRQGSIVVRPGDQVGAGQLLGLVGMSGNTNFPHVHLTVRYKNLPVDPFAAAGANPRLCDGGPSIWTAAAARQMPYSPVDLVAIGVSAAQPNLAGIAAGTYAAKTASASAGELHVWMLLWNANSGDRAQLTLTGPDGRQLVSNTTMIVASHRTSFRSAGVKAKGRWPAGTYRIAATLERPGRDRIIRQRADTFVIR